MSVVGNQGSQGALSATVRVDSGGGITANYNSVNVVSAVKNGAGDYTVTLAEGVASSNVIPNVMPAGSATGICVLDITQASATVWNIKFIDADKAAKDTAFWFSIHRSYP